MEANIGTEDLPTVDDGCSELPSTFSVPTARLNEVLVVLQTAPSEPSDGEMKDVIDACDQLLYWGNAERHFPQLDSGLHKGGATPVLLTLLSHPRVLIVISAADALTSIVRHPQVCAAVRGVEGVAALFSQVMARAPNKEELQQQMLLLATTLSAQPDLCSSILCSPLPSAVLTAMARHKRNADVQLHGSVFFAALAEVKPERDDIMPPAIPLAQEGAVVETVLAACDAFPNHSDIAGAVAACMLALGARPENTERLMGTKCLGTLVRVCEMHPRSTRTAVAAVTAIAQLVPQMDTMQKKRLVLTARKLMTTVGEPSVLAACCALCLALATSTESDGTPEELLELKQYMGMNVVQLIGISLQHFDDDAVLQSVGDQCLRALTINKFHH